MALFDPKVFSRIWRYVRAHNQYAARDHTTRSRRNARWLVRQIEKWSYVEVSDTSGGPCTGEWLPVIVPGITDEQWDEYRRIAWSEPL